MQKLLLKQLQLKIRKKIVMMMHPLRHHLLEEELQRLPLKQLHLKIRKKIVIMSHPLNQYLLEEELQRLSLKQLQLKIRKQIVIMSHHLNFRLPEEELSDRLTMVCHLRDILGMKSIPQRDNAQQRWGCKWWYRGGVRCW